MPGQRFQQRLDTDPGDLHADTNKQKRNDSLMITVIAVAPRIEPDAEDSLRLADDPPRNFTSYQTPFSRVGAENNR